MRARWSHKVRKESPERMPLMPLPSGRIGSDSEWNSGVLGGGLAEEGERTTLGVLADRPSLPRMHHAPTERLHPRQRIVHVGDREVGQRERIPRSTSALMDPDRRTAGARLPALPRSISAHLQLDFEQSRPETPGALGIIGGELDQGQRGVRHDSHDNGRSAIAAQAGPARQPIRFVDGESERLPMGSADGRRVR
jgi:hypothetical protein